MKVIREGKPPWIGVWECKDCGERVVLTAEDAAEICWNLPSGAECILPWGYRESGMFFGERVVGPCTTCRKDNAFFPVDEMEKI